MLAKDLQGNDIQILVGLGIYINITKKIIYSSLFLFNKIYESERDFSHFCFYEEL